MQFGEIPIVVVFANENRLLEQIQDGVATNAKGFTFDLKTVRKAFGTLKDLALVLGRLTMAIKTLTAQMEGFPVKKYVHTKNGMFSSISGFESSLTSFLAHEAPKNLLMETSTLLSGQSAQIIGIKAQRLELKPKIALATEDSIRAYVMWYMHKQHGQKQSFSRNPRVNAMKLTNMIMEPILSTFNMRFERDDELIIAEIGKPWNALDNCRNGLCDAVVPGDLIMLCTLDTILVMARALKHTHDDHETEEERQTAVAITEADIKSACQWYRGSAQAETHAKIQHLLTADGEPKDNSIANFQMKVIEIVELRSKRARKRGPMYGLRRVLRGGTLKRVVAPSMVFAAVYIAVGIVGTLTPLRPSVWRFWRPFVSLGHCCAWGWGRCRRVF